MKPEPRISMPVSVAKELMNAYDNWAGSLPVYVEDSQEWPRDEYLSRHEALRKRIDRLLED